jgi:4-diphosphocytidyl-2-C-methyl-D-erythritol kinase
MRCASATLPTERRCPYHDSLSAPIDGSHRRATTITDAREAASVAAEDIDGTALRVRVPAKLNLFLAVRGRRADGYHELVTVFQTVSVYDDLRVALLGLPGRRHHPAARRHMRVELWADATLPQGRDNIALRAALLLGELSGIVPAEGGADRDAVRTIIDLDKRIPVTAGMAGGSADAAGVLVALNRLWRCGLSVDQLRAVGADIGSDVPFCVTGGTALGAGRGTDITPVLARGPFHWVICTDPEPLSTPAVYRAWDLRSRPTGTRPDDVLYAVRSTDPGRLAAALHNELEEAAFSLRPRLRTRKQQLLEAGALAAVLAGSGSTLLALAADEPAAYALAAAIEHWCPQVLVATSPAGGPELSRDAGLSDTGPLLRTLE